MLIIKYKYGFIQNHMHIIPRLTVKYTEKYKQEQKAEILFG